MKRHLENFGWFLAGLAIPMTWFYFVAVEVPAGLTDTDGYTLKWTWYCIKQ